MFGTDSEKTRGLFGWNGSVDDPLAEDAPFEGEAQEPDDIGLVGRQYSGDAAIQDIKNWIDGSEEGTGQTMSNWLFHFCGWDRHKDKTDDEMNGNALLQRVFRRLRKELDTTSIIRQCDETTWKVIV